MQQLFDKVEQVFSRVDDNPLGARAESSAQQETPNQGVCDDLLCCRSFVLVTHAVANALWWTWPIAVTIASSHAVLHGCFVSGDALVIGCRVSATLYTRLSASAAVAAGLSLNSKVMRFRARESSFVRYATKGKP
jgi:hypothetical protein